MSLTNPPHPGLLVKANLEELGISVQDAALSLQMNPQHLEDITNGMQPITADVAVRLGKAFKHDHTELFLRLQTAYDLAQAKRNIGELQIPQFKMAS